MWELLLAGWFLVWMALSHTLQALPRVVHLGREELEVLEEREEVEEEDERAAREVFDPRLLSPEFSAAPLLPPLQRIVVHGEGGAGELGGGNMYNMTHTGNTPSRIRTNHSPPRD